jgi:hypothetical protein
MNVQNAIELLQQCDPKARLMWHDALEGNDCEVQNIFKLEDDNAIRISPTSKPPLEQIYRGKAKCVANEILPQPQQDSTEERHVTVQQWLEAASNHQCVYKCIDFKNDYTALVGLLCLGCRKWFTITVNDFKNTIIDVNPDTQKLFLTVEGRVALTQFLNQGKIPK